MTTYKLTTEGYVLRDGVVKVPTNVPWCEGSEDYQAFVAWQAAGNVPAPADPPPVVVPPAVTMRQARLALHGAGLLDNIAPAIAAIPDASTRRAAEIEWEFSNELQRANPFVANLGAALGLTPGQVDALFVQAATL